jgi:hypothetical protein
VAVLGATAEELRGSLRVWRARWAAILSRRGHSFSANAGGCDIHRDSI